MLEHFAVSLSVALASTTATRGDDHVVVGFHDDAVVVVNVKHVEWLAFCRRATRRRHTDRIDRMHLRRVVVLSALTMPNAYQTLHDRMIGGVE